VLSLLLAARRPTFYLIENPQALRDRTDSYLKLLAEEGVISDRVRDEALAAYVAPGAKPFVPDEVIRGDRSDARSIRNRLSQMLGVRNLYDLDRLDLTVESTVDEHARDAITRVLESIKQPDVAISLGLTGEHLLSADAAGADKIVYAFTLYEVGETSNRLRVHADTLGSALDVNDAVMLDLGSTAKLRTLVTYLEVMSELQLRFAKMTPAELAKVEVYRTDALTAWALDRVRHNPDEPLPAFLDASMQREYSASPAETFFTGGGIHRFNNFNKDDDYKRFTVATAFRHSVNLVFIRMMRDIVNYHSFSVCSIVGTAARPPSRSSTASPPIRA
jgi:membrane peptidoglycan carboxypeptidase